MQSIEFPKFKTYTNQKVNWYQPKLDGHLTKVHIDDTGFITCLTKNDKDITGKLLSINHIAKELKAIPKNSILFAELHSPGIPATSVPTLLNEASEKLMLTFFAAPLLNNKNLCGSSIDNVMFELKTLGLSVASPSYIPKGFVDETGKKAMLELAIENKWEGWVLKEEHLKGWYKLKPVKTIDVIVIGTMQSFSSTHYGGLQGIYIAVYNGDKLVDLGQVGSGFDLEYRKSLNTKEKRNELIGRVCEVAFDSLAAKNKLRFPRFLRWRIDKNPNQCTMEQLK